MLKMLIVDDEPMIAELIYNLIHWQELPVGFIGSCHNGLDAYQKIIQEQPEIVITDIRMPGMDGLELIAQIRSLNMLTMFIVMSGYSEFEYAKTALKYGVEDYLVKPVNEDELNALVKTLADKTIQQIRQQKKFSENNNKLNHYTAQLRKNELSMLLHNPDYQVDRELLKLIPGKINIAIVKLDVRTTVPDFSEFTPVLEKICELLLAAAAAYEILAEFYVSKNKAYLLTNTDKEKESFWIDQSDAVRKILQKTEIIFASYSVTIGVGIDVDSEDRVQESMQTAQQAVDKRILLGSGIIIHYAALSHMETKQELFSLDEKLLKQVSRSIIAFDAEEIIGCLKAYFNEFQRTMLSRSYLIYTIVTQIVEKVHNTLHEEGVFSKKEANRRTMEAALKLNNFGRINDVLNYLYDYLREMNGIHFQQKSSQDSKPISTAKQYVLDHLNRQISLEEVAEAASITPNYLSFLFKSKTSQSFMEYVIEARMERAKELLRNTQVVVSDIATQVGYADARHFAKLFKKTVGLTPGEYRKYYS